MNASTMGLRGRHAGVTGGGRGIGAAIARLIAEQGILITLMGRTQATLEQEAALLRALTEVHCETVDVANAGSVESAFANATRALGPATILINNAGQAATIGRAHV